MEKEAILSSIGPMETQEVSIEYDSNIGFKNDIKYSETEFATLWNAMLKDVEPNVEISTDDNQQFILTTFGLMIDGYACTLGGDVTFDLSEETEQFIYFWSKLNFDTELLTFIFDTSGADLSENDTDREKNKYLGKFNQISTNHYFWNKETDTGVGSRLDKLLKPDILENDSGWNTGATIKLPKPINQYTRMIVYGLDQSLQRNIILEGLLPEQWLNSSSARAYQEWSDGKTLHSYNVLLNKPTGSQDDEAHLQTAATWRHNTVAGKPHTKAYDFKVIKIKLYNY